MKRIALNPEELALVERLRADRAVHNRAIAEALSALAGLSIERAWSTETLMQAAVAAVAACRKEN